MLTLGQLGQVFPLEQIISLQEDFTQTRRSSGVVSIIESVESVELLVRMHVERIDRQIVRGQVERFEYFLQGQVLAITVNDDFLLSARVNQRPWYTCVGSLSQLGLDESQEMFLVHTRRVVNVSVDLSDVVEVSAHQC